MTGQTVGQAVGQTTMDGVKLPGAECIVPGRLEAGLGSGDNTDAKDTKR